MHSKVANYYRSHFQNSKDKSLLGRISYHFDKAKNIQNTLSSLESICTACIHGYLLDESQALLLKLITHIESGWGKFTEESRSILYSLLGQAYFEDNQVIKH